MRESSRRGLAHGLHREVFVPPFHILGAAAAGAVAGLASIPHCMGMCGPLVAGVCAGRREGGRYQLGRTLSYGALGGLAGGVVALSVSPLATGLASRLLSALMVLGLLWVALRLVRSSLGPVALANDNGRASAAPVPLRPKNKSGAPRWVQRMRPFLASPLMVGALSALLPCAALLNMGVLAAASGSVAAGALTGVAFATTTGVGLATSVWASALLRQSRAGSLVMAGVLVLGAAIVTVRAVPSLVGAPSASDGGAACHTEASDGRREAGR